MKSWFEELMSRDQRTAPRHLAPRLVAYYWDGAAPAARCIRDISSTGLYLLTAQRWYPGTLVTITLQRTDKDDAGKHPAIAVQARVIRTGEDGVAFSFVLPQTADARRVQQYVAEGVELADRNTLARFLSPLWTQRPFGLGR